MLNDVFFFCIKKKFLRASLPSVIGKEMMDFSSWSIDSLLIEYIFHFLSLMCSLLLFSVRFVEKNIIFVNMKLLVKTM